MDLDIFTSTQNWNFTELDVLAQEKFSKLEEETRASLPQNFYYKKTLTHKEFVRSTELYKLLKTLPKAVMHHLHIDCAEDEEFYRLYVATDPNVYLDQERKHFKIGTKKQAQAQKWLSMEQEKLKHKSQQEFVDYISNITMFNTKELINFSYIQAEMWEIFQQKISNFFEIYFALHIFKKYIHHVLLKYIKNGYDRIEFRALLCQLTEYDSDGNIVIVHPQEMYLKAFDQSYNEIRKQYPNFTAGIVFFGLKVFTAEDNEALFDKICQLNWDKTIGLDFVQQEDAFGSLQLYDPIIDKVLNRYPHLDYKKVYHAGETKDHLTSNLQIAVKAGSVRIGHGFNVLQRIEFLPHCKNICFEKNPLSNLVLGYNIDAREASAPILLGLGYAVTINPDDPGKFGVQDSTFDYFLSAISYNWTLKHLKLIAYHSINHAICDQHTKHITLKSFNQKWNNWVKQFVGAEKPSLSHQWVEPDMYNNTSNWNWTSEDEQFTSKVQKVRAEAIKQLPRGFYQESSLQHLKKSKNNSLYQLLKTVPKGTLHNCHFEYNFDQQFLRKYIINDPNIYFNKANSKLCFGTKEQADQGNWTSLAKLQQELNGQQQLVAFIHQVLTVSSEEISKIQRHSKKVWQLFTDKTDSILSLLKIKHIFKHYCSFVLRKYYLNGYNRVQFRSSIHKLKEHDASGQFLSQLNESQYTKIIDEAYLQVSKECPNFTIGFIFVGLRSLSNDQNKNILTRVCQINWNKTIAFDFLEESSNGYDNIVGYNKIVDEVLSQFQHLHYKKCYHAGDTRDHLDQNVEDAVMLGSVRIGNGINIIQRVQFLNHCRNVCFQLNPISNSIASYSARSDLRLSIAPILLGLGYPVSINPDFPAIFGFADNTEDYFVSSVAFNWTLKHLKLIAIHSISHAICTQGTRLKLSKAFQNRWAQWITNNSK